MTLDRGSYRQWHHLPRSVLFLATFSAIFLLFFGAFSTPYIDFIYFVKVDGVSLVDTVTLGTFGFCFESAGVKNCSPGITGYQLDSNPFSSFLGPTLLPLIPAAVTRALVLHVVAFVFSLLTAIAVLCSTWKSGHNFFNRYIIYPVLILIVFNLASFIADLVLFSAAKNAFGTTAAVSIGNGTWLTFVSLLLLVLALLFHRPYKPEPISKTSEKRDLFDDLEAYRQERKQDDLSSQKHDQSPSSTQNKLFIHTMHITARSPNVEPQAASPAPAPAPAPAKEQTVLAPVRRTNIEINVIPSESPPHTTSPILASVHQEQLLQQTSPTPSSQSRMSTSGYAPSVYSTCYSDGSHLTPGTLSRASSSAAAHAARHAPARRSTLNPHAIEQLFYLGSHAGLTGRRRITARYDRYSSSTASSPSPGGSLFHGWTGSTGGGGGGGGGGVVTIPSPPPFSLQFRDRFIENNPGIPLDTRSFVSAVPSSDIELDVQTLPPSTPRRSYSYIPPLPGQQPLEDPDEISFA